MITGFMGFAVGVKGTRCGVQNEYVKWRCE